MAAFNFPNSPNTNDTHTENGVTWKYNGYAWDRVESVGAQGAQGIQGSPGVQGSGGTGVQGSPGVQGATGHQGVQGTAGSTSSNAGTVTIRTDNGNAYHQLVFVDSTTDNQPQILKMDDEYSRLMWNPNNETLVIYRAQPYQIKTWSGSYGTSGQVLASGGSGAAWTWQDSVTDVAVSYTGRSAPCTLPITITGTTTKTINIPDSSNAFGAKYVQNTEPTGSSVCAGDVWYDTSTSGGGGGSGSFVTGMIMLWSGSSGSIPSGWVLCNGSNSTPDLRNRFIIGAGDSYSVDATGGSKNAVLIGHSHTFSVVNVSGNEDDAGALSDGDANSTSQRSTTGAGIDSDGATDLTQTGTDANLPPYYALCYIMKT